MNKKIAVLLAGLTVLGMVGQASAQVQNDTEADIDVQISEKTAIDISPENLDFGNLAPGETATEATGDNGVTYSALEVENAGSSNISQLYFNTSAPDTNPFGTGVASNYDVGNWIQIAPQETEMPGIPDASNHVFVSRVDFNESNDLSYVNVPDNFNYGRFRVGNEEYFWAVDASGTSGTAGGCATGTGTFRVGNTAHARDTTGTVDLSSTGGDVTGYEVSDVNGNYGGVASVDVGSRTYDVLVNCEGDSTKTVRTRYNPEPLGVDVSGLSGVADYILDSTNGGEAMFPGEHFTTNVSLNVPRGVAATGGSETGTLTVVASTS